MARNRYFVRVVKPFGIYRPDHEVCLEQDEYDRAAGAVTLMATEVDGVMKADAAAEPESEGDAGAEEKPKAKAKAK